MGLPRSSDARMHCKCTYFISNPVDRYTYFRHTHNTHARVRATAHMPRSQGRVIMGYTTAERMLSGWAHGTKPNTPRSKIAKNRTTR